MSRRVAVGKAAHAGNAAEQESMADSTSSDEAEAESVAGRAVSGLATVNEAAVRMGVFEM